MQDRVAKNIDEFIFSASPDAQSHLNELRTIINSTISGVEERIWYRVPFFFYHGELVGLSVSKNHVGFGFGQGVISDNDRKSLIEMGYTLGKGTLQIKFDQEIPSRFIKVILKTKAKMNKDREV